MAILGNDAKFRFGFRSLSSFALLGVAVICFSAWSDPNRIQPTELYLGSGSYGGGNVNDEDVAEYRRGVVFDSRTETPSYDGTHNIKNHGINAGAVDPECAVLPRYKCLPSNLVGWRHGTPLPKKYSDFVQSVTQHWVNPETEVSKVDPGSQEALHAFDDEAVETQSIEPPWDHPGEAAHVFKALDSSKASENFANSPPRPTEGTSGDGIQNLKAEVAELKRAVHKVTERRRLQRSIEELRKELEQSESGDPSNVPPQRMFAPTTDAYVHPAPLPVAALSAPPASHASDLVPMPADHVPHDVMARFWRDDVDSHSTAAVNQPAADLSPARAEDNHAVDWRRQQRLWAMADSRERLARKHAAAIRAAEAQSGGQRPAAAVVVSPPTSQRPLDNFFDALAESPRGGGGGGGGRGAAPAARGGGGGRPVAESGPALMREMGRLESTLSGEAAGIRGILRALRAAPAS